MAPLLVVNKLLLSILFLCSVVSAQIPPGECDGCKEMARKALQKPNVRKCRNKCKKDSWSKENDCTNKRCCKKICKNFEEGEEEEACEDRGYCRDGCYMSQSCQDAGYSNACCDCALSQSACEAENTGGAFPVFANICSNVCLSDIGPAPTEFCGCYKSDEFKCQSGPDGNGNNYCDKSFCEGLGSPYIWTGGCRYDSSEAGCPSLTSGVDCPASSVSF